MRRRNLQRVVAVTVALALAGAAAACPVCDSDTGREVRVGVLDDDLGINLVKVLLPFPVALGIVGLLYVVAPNPGGGGSRRGGGQ